MASPAFHDTIVAVATPMGQSGIGVVRISGPDAISIATRLFQSRRPLVEAQSHTAHHGWVSYHDERIDESVATVYRTPNSYTGEDVVELACHGSPPVLKAVVRWCCELGARLARPGEFTQRAYVHGRMDLAQAEAVASMISAQSIRAASMAASQLAGGLSNHINRLRESAIHLLADIEANLDFVEEDIPGLPQSQMIESLDQLCHSIQNLLTTSVHGRLLRDGVLVALVGRPNAGKSSLFNAFLAENRAIVTDIPGTTRDTIEEKVQWGGFAVKLLDTAGQRESQDPIEIEGAQRARQAQEKADVVVYVIDGSEPLHDDERRLAQTLASLNVVVAINKSDRGLQISPVELASHGIQQSIVVSALNGSGLAELREKILSFLPDQPDDGQTGCVITNERHAQELSKALLACKSALSSLKQGGTEELIAADLKSVASHLSLIIGRDADDDVLTSIFSRFCIGK